MPEPVRNRVAQTEPFAKNALGKPVRNVWVGITERELKRHRLVESSRLERGAIVCFLWVRRCSNNRSSRLESAFAIELRARRCASGVETPEGWAAFGTAALRASG